MSHDLQFKSLDTIINVSNDNQNHDIKTIEKIPNESVLHPKLNSHFQKAIIMTLQCHDTVDTKSNKKMGTAGDDDDDDDDDELDIRWNNNSCQWITLHMTLIGEMIYDQLSLLFVCIHGNVDDDDESTLDVQLDYTLVNRSL